MAISDVSTGERIKKFRGHQEIVNSISTSRRGQEMICSVGDDGLVKVWDVRMKDAAKNYEEGFPLLATAFSRDGDVVYTSGIANQINVKKLRRHS